MMAATWDRSSVGSQANRSSETGFVQLPYLPQSKGMYVQRARDLRHIPGYRENAVLLCKTDLRTSGSSAEANRPELDWNVFDISRIPLCPVRGRTSNPITCTTSREPGGA